jgi:hypothetical protein
MKKRHKKKVQKIRCQALANGPIQSKVKGSKKGKKGYNRKNKNWKKEL